MNRLDASLVLVACLALAPAVKAAPQTYDFTGKITFSATDPSWVGKSITGSIVVDLANANYVYPSTPTFSGAVFSEYSSPAAVTVVAPSFTLPDGSTQLDIAPPYFVLNSSVFAYFHNTGVDQFQYRSSQDGCPPVQCNTNVPRNQFQLTFRDDKASGKMITSSSLEQTPNLAFATSAVGNAYYVIADGGPNDPPGTFDFAYYVNFNITSFTAAQPVPEPGTWALMGLGLAGLAGMARRRARG